MAVETKTPEGTARGAGVRRFLVGSNVVAATALMVAIVIVAQLIAYHARARWDMTASGINSLSEATERLVRNLDQNVRLTSLYFETDREEEDQPRYRRAVGDLLNLYESTNRARVRAEWINPLKDHERFRSLQARLREKSAFQEEIAAYTERIERFEDDLSTSIAALITAELEQARGLGAGMGPAGANDRLQSGITAQQIFGQIEKALMEMSRRLDRVREVIDVTYYADTPEYTTATSELRSFYTTLSQTLTNIARFAGEQVRQAEVEPGQAAFLREAGNRYAELTADLETEITKLQDLMPLTYDDIITQLAPTANAILVETENEARVVDFSSVWPPVQPGADGRAGFANRAFKGEEKVTAAVLRVTHKEQTAVVFVRYGGTPLFLGGFAPGQPPAPYARVKQQLEDANFMVEEWDVKASTTPPTIEPTPTRTIYVVLQPQPPQRGPMGQPSPEPPFGDSQRRAVLDAVAEGGRALFVAGWYPGPLGLIPAEYEYSDYLKDEWGIEVDSSTLVIQTFSRVPGQYLVTGGRDFLVMRDVNVTDHDIVSDPLARAIGLPFCAPLVLSPPSGVEHERLVYLPKRDGLWGVKNLQAYQEQYSRRNYLTKEPDDLEGPFDLAVAAEKENQKVAVISSAQFAEDMIAFATDFMLTSRGLEMRLLQPGNVGLLINALHWLNDNTEFMNIGKPIDAAVLRIDSERTVKAVQALTIFGWPLTALLVGGAVWWVRRR